MSGLRRLRQLLWAVPILVSTNGLFAADDDWQVRDFGAFSIRIPAALFQTQGGVDSLSGTLVGKGFTLRYDYGRYADPLLEREDVSNYQARAEAVNGLAARRVSFETPAVAGGKRWCEGVHIARVGKPAPDQTRFTMLACADDASALRWMDLILTSLRFEQPPIR